VFDTGEIPESAGVLFGTLGGVTMTARQAMVWIFTTPPPGAAFWSMTPYLTASSRYRDIYPMDMPFHSMPDSVNNWDAARELNVPDGMSKRIAVIFTCNRTLAERVRACLPLDVEWATCLPIPCASTYGELYDAWDVPMLRGGASNPNVSATTRLADAQTDQFAMVFRCAAEAPTEVADGAGLSVADWYDATEHNQEGIVLGVELNAVERAVEPSDLFALCEQNGRFVLADDGATYAWTAPAIPTVGLSARSSWKIPLPAHTNERDPGELGPDMRAASVALDEKILATQQEMYDAGFTRCVEVTMYHDTWNAEYARRTSAPFYNNGFWLNLHLVPGLGNSTADTTYTASDSFCLGRGDVAVAFSFDHAALGNATYNNLSLYNMDSLQAIGHATASYNGGGGDEAFDASVLVKAASRTDYRCHLVGAL
jgi:hypothetical protein